MATDKAVKEDPLASVRDTVVSVWIAIVLAFVLRAFVIEAFMIPTGSMAPRLMGKHAQFDCDACGYHYPFGLDSGKDADISRPVRVESSVCPNCGKARDRSIEWAFGGDRVLVLKYLYRFCPPKPWDVVVFRNPLNNEENYIPRLIGLPGQMIEIVHGDVFFRQGKDFDGNGVVDVADFADPRAAEQCPWKILRKPPATQEVMWQNVYDSDYPPDAAVLHGWQRPWGTPEAQDAWRLDAHGGRVLSFAGSPEPAEVRYNGGRRRFFPRYAYNRPGKSRWDVDRDVCYDLKLSFMFVPENASARVGLHLSSFDDHFLAWVGADGKVAIEHGRIEDDGRVTWKTDPSASDALVPLPIGRGCDVALTHVDHRVTLWVAGKAVLTTTDAQYSLDKDRVAPRVEEALRRHSNGLPAPTVAILGQGGPAKLWHVKLMRDVYYTANADRVGAGDSRTGEPGWGTTGNAIVLRKFEKFPDLDEFYVLGDNSPASKDSRMWGYHADTMRGSDFACRSPQGKGDYAFMLDGKYRYRYHNGTVPRYNMIGKAFFVYWPGGFRPPLLRRLPIVPNVGRMRLVK